MARDKHPPKKKHVNRARPTPAPPLTNAQRGLKARAEFAKAMSHLGEAESMAEWGYAPNACAHAAYYAMHHAAAAAVLAAGGVGKYKDVPKSHEHVIEHYGKLVSGEPEPLAHSGMALSRARTDRMVADYDLELAASLEGARETTIAAREMLDVIKIRWGF